MPDGVVAVAGCRRTAEAEPDDLYPDPDAAPLQDAFQRLGVPSELVSWDDPTLRWDRFSHVVISSTWDSVDRPSEYLAWARRAAGQTRLTNDLAFIEWNLDKRHQVELEAAGIDVIPTVWVAPGQPWAPPSGAEFVVKPSVSAGGRSTARYAPGDPASMAHVRSLHDCGQTVMVQPYLGTIDTAGEVDMIFFDGTFSHAVNKRPALTVGAGVVDRPWERMAWDGLVSPTAAELATAEAALLVAADRLGRYPTYGRVDVIAGPARHPAVLEMELIDPYLSLDVAGAAATLLAAAVLRS